MSGLGKPETCGAIGNPMLSWQAVSAAVSAFFGQLEAAGLGQAGCLRVLHGCRGSRLLQVHSCTEGARQLCGRPRG
jgi:hypothetical protein